MDWDDPRRPGTVLLGKARDKALQEHAEWLRNPQPPERIRHKLEDMPVRKRYPRGKRLHNP